MFALQRMMRGGVFGLAAAVLWGIPSLANAQNVGIQNGIVTNVQQGNTGNNMSPTPQTRNTFQVNNAINYWQYQQTTGMGPSIGWVRIITQFPQNGQQNGFGGGLNSGFTGNINLGANGNAGNQQPNNGGSDPPSGVFLAANYGTLVGLPLQQQQQQQGGFGGGIGFGGGLGGFGGNPYGGIGGKGIGGFGNGGDGL